MTNSSIEWTNNTHNPWEGCNKVSPGCDFCYAEARDQRFHHGAHWGKDAPRLFHTDAYWNEPMRWYRRAEAAGIPERVFCGSLCDVMEDRRDLDAPRARLYELIEATSPWLDWLLLTKRPQNFHRLLPRTWRDEPRKNVWLLTTVEQQDQLWRAEALIRVPAAIHGLSVEPLLGPLHLGRLAWDLDWIIIGGESGPNSREFHIEWARNLIAECRAADVAVFVKQLGARPRDGSMVMLRDLKGGDPEEWPTDLRLRQLPYRFPA